MPRVDVRELDHSAEMKAFFGKAIECLEEVHELSSEVARALVDRYFSLDVAPLERVFTMHNAAEDVAADLAAGVRTRPSAL